MILFSDRLYVRQYTLEDEEAFYRLNSDEEIMRYIRPAKNRQESKAFLLENLQFYKDHPNLGRWALIEKSTSQLVGTFSLLPLEHTTNIHIGYALMKEYWGKGYASEIVKAGMTYAFNQLGLPSLVAITYPEHLVSQKVLLRNGFHPEGVYNDGGKDSLLFRINRGIN